MKNLYYWVIGAVLVVGGVWLTTSKGDVAMSVMDSLPTIGSSTQDISMATVPNADEHYQFNAKVPAGWAVEAVGPTQAINFYDPNAAGANNLEKSQIFVRYFVASSFLTLSTVDILNRSEGSIGGSPTVRYEILKKANVAKFANQPSWRSEQHIVTDIRVHSASHATFYVIAKRPDLDEATYQDFLQSISHYPSTEGISWVAPIADWDKRVTKKPYGILISPENSPVSPERFSGYHTAIDVEYGDVGSDVPVYAIGNGKVVLSRSADGYGGVVAISHEPWAGIYSIYGHLKISSLPRVGSSVAAGQQIGVLGAGESRDTDGERKHLHFGIYQGEAVNIAGYVATKSELSYWIDPAMLLK